MRSDAEGVGAGTVVGQDSFVGAGVRIAGAVLAGDQRSFLTDSPLRQLETSSRCYCELRRLDFARASTGRMAASSPGRRESRARQKIKPLDRGSKLGEDRAS